MAARRPRRENDLHKRIRAACCPISGLTYEQFERHLDAIAQTVGRAHARRDLDLRTRRANRPKDTP